MRERQTTNSWNMLGEEILYLPIRELQAHLRKHSFSPTELARSYLDRSQRIGSKLNAYITITEELALEQAHAAEREILAGHHRGPLHGIPYALKDVVAVKGYRTTWGCAALRRSEVRTQCHDCRETKSGRCGADRKGRND
jgi:Asp-tRNA(Asn)/Glu-tRNA(Gln) amidotransferase A subunit family amidase